MLADAGLTRKSIYPPGEVQQILKISDSTFRRFCDLWEPGVGGKPYGIECIRFATHRRVTHQALVDWVMRNHGYDRDNGL